MASDLDLELDLNWLISVDDHILEPPNVWVDRVASKDRDRAPHMEYDGGLDYWVYDGKRYPSSGLSAVVGKSKEEFSPEPLPYSEMRPGCYDPTARLEDMDRAGVLASLCFPTITRFCGQLFMEASDREFGLVCLKAYNDWIIEEWCGAAPGRYIPLVLIPMWDPALAVAELERCAAKGATSFAFSENPAPLGLPTIHDANRYWDPVMAAANDLEMVVSMHVGSSSQIPKIAPDAPFMANLAWGAMRTSGTMLSWLFSGLFQRFPKLKIALSEGEIGWMPYYLERAEQVLDKQRHWVKKGARFMDHATTDVDLDTLDVRALFRDHVFGCFIDDAHGIASIEEIGEDNIMCETDYPHSDSTWPDSIGVVRRRIGHLPPETQYKLLRGNAERLYRFTPAEPPPSPAPEPDMPGNDQGLLAGKSAVVTGAGSGVGRASAMRFAEEGARVVCADLDVDRAKETVGLVEAAGGVAVAVAADVAVEDDVVGMLAAAADRFGRLDIVFNNAGIPTPRLGATLEDHTVEDFQRLVAVNFLGVFLGCKHAVVRFKEQGGGGVILNTGSVAGLVAWGGSVYGATKGAVHQLTRAVASEGAPFGIRANAICPAGMPFTNFMAAGGMGSAGPDDLQKVADQVGATHPLGRPITAEDCAEAAVYLVSDRAANVTGVLLPVDGGYVAR